MGSGSTDLASTTIQSLQSLSLLQHPSPQFLQIQPSSSVHTKSRPSSASEYSARCRCGSVGLAPVPVLPMVPSG